MFFSPWVIKDKVEDPPPPYPTHQLFGILHHYLVWIYLSGRARQSAMDGTEMIVEFYLREGTRIHFTDFPVNRPKNPP